MKLDTWERLGAAVGILSDDTGTSLARPRSGSTTCASIRSCCVDLEMDTAGNLHERKLRKPYVPDAQKDLLSPSCQVRLLGGAQDQGRDVKRNWFVRHGFLKDREADRQYDEADEQAYKGFPEAMDALLEEDRKVAPDAAWWYYKPHLDPRYWMPFRSGSDEWNRHTKVFQIPLLGSIVFASSKPHLDRWDDGTHFVCFPTKTKTVGLHRDKTPDENGMVIDRNEEGEIVFVNFGVPLDKSI